MPLETFPHDSAEYLDTSEAIAAYLEDALDSGNADEIAHALGVVARAKGMSKVARNAGVSRPALARALSSEGPPGRPTGLAVLKALGLRLTVQLERAA